MHMRMLVRAALFARSAVQCTRLSAGSALFFSTASASSDTGNATDTNAKIKISERAVSRLNLINKKSEKPRALRIMVDSGGCSGFAYKFDLIDPTTEVDVKEDIIFSQDGATVVVDDVTLELIEGSTVDYTMELIKRAFVVTGNPNAEAGCGCGISFSLKDVD